MDTQKILSEEFSSLAFAGSERTADADSDEKYRMIARNYAEMENVIAVLSDFQSNTSCIYYSAFAQNFITDKCGKYEEVPSIWEEELFGLIHPDDLRNKHLQELRFLRFIRGLPKNRRAEYCLMSRLRMKGLSESYIPVLHRMFYIQDESGGSLRMALCLYGPLIYDLSADCVIINSVKGEIKEMRQDDNPNILTPREKQILGMIDRGKTSKEIASDLSISLHTVSRHRQDILEKLQAGNSIEACRIARDLNLL